MNIFLEFKIALQNLKKNLLRTFLSIGGITIGITTIIVVLSIGSAIESLILGQISTIGADSLFVEIKVPTGTKETASAAAIAQGVQITTLKQSDTEEILKLPNINKAYSAITGQAILSYRNEEKSYLYWAATSELADLNNWNIAQGRFFNESEERSLARVVVLGHEVAKKLFEEENPIGKQIKINRLNFKVIGVNEPRGVEFFNNVDENIYIPLKTAQKLLLGVDHILFIGLKMGDQRKQDETVADIQNLLRKRHNIKTADKDDFAVRTLDEATDILGSVSFGITVLLLLVAGISLLVGGVGIMNVMYVSVTERTKEIGLLKAIGAKDKSILAQFLLEALIITFWGGIFGIILGLSFSFLISIIAKNQGLDWKFIISLESILFATITSALIGVIFGYYPAKKASELEPIKALRWE